MELFPLLESLSVLPVRRAISGLSFYQVWPLSSLALFLWQAANMSLYPLRKTRKKPLLLESNYSWIRTSNLQNNPSMLPTFKMVSVKRPPNS